MSQSAANAPNIEKGIPLTRSQNLVLVLDTPKGRGVFASQPIPARTILEVSPVLVLHPTENEEHIRKTDLYNYTYNWPYTPADSDTHMKAPTKTQAIILGLGSMFNHSSLNQNVVWMRDLDRLTITYKTLRDIKQDEELCISYGDRLTFVDTELEEWKRAEREKCAKVDEGKGAEEALLDALPGSCLDELDTASRDEKAGGACKP